MSHMVKCYRCTKCGHKNANEPSKGDCSAWFGCGFKKGEYEIVDISIQEVREEENAEANAQGGLVLWVIHAVIVGFSKGAAKGFLALIFGPLMWFF